jgi:hypothetical protein
MPTGAVAPAGVCVAAVERLAANALSEFAQLGLGQASRAGARDSGDGGGGATECEERSCGLSNGREFPHGLAPVA